MADVAQNCTNFAWNGRRVRAAILVAEDSLSDDQIAESVGMKRRQLENWKRHPDFQARVAEEVSNIRAQALKLPIAKVHERVKVLDVLHTKALTVIDERAAEYAQTEEEDALDEVWRAFRNGGVPAGGGTGLIVKQYKQIGSGRNAQLVTEYAVDTGLMREITNLHARAAKELGQEDTEPSVARLDLRLYIGVDVEAV